MTLKEANKMIDAIYPLKTQYKWDKSGMTYNSRPETKLCKVIVCLDFDEQILKAAVSIGANLVVCHHPIMPGPATARLVHQAKRMKVSYMANHSNFDKSPVGMNYVLGKKLKLQDMHQHTDKITMLGELKKPVSLASLAKKAKRAFHVKTATAYECRNGASVKRVALVGGAGMSHLPMLRNLKIDCFITGDVKWHGHREAAVYGIDVIDVEHYAEQAFIDAIEPLFKQQKVRVVKIYPKDVRKVY